MLRSEGDLWHRLAKATRKTRVSPKMSSSRGKVSENFEHQLNRLERQCREDGTRVPGFLRVLTRRDPAGIYAVAQDGQPTGRSELK